MGNLQSAAMNSLKPIHTEAALNFIQTLFHNFFEYENNTVSLVTLQEVYEN